MAPKAMGNGGRIILQIEEFVIEFGDGGYRDTPGRVRDSIGQFGL